MLETERANLLHSTPKQITEEFRWRSLPGDRFRINVKVLAPELNEILWLRCFLGKTNYGFTLLFRSYAIRSYNKHQFHRSQSTREEFRVPHKHIWDEDTGTDTAYIPDDIDPNSDINSQLIAFLREENIELTAGYQRIMFVN